MRNYCTVCDWTAHSDEYTQEERARAAINHFHATGHTIQGDGPEQDRRHQPEINPHKIAHTLR